MLSPELNERIARVGPGTPMGRLQRRYWQPACLSEELPEPDGPPIRVRLLGEDLIAFRDSSGAVGVVSAFCPHRRAPMFFGRNEDCGLRCVYHGWKFDRSGACVDMPSEPPDSLFKDKVRIDAYPAWEAGGIVWTYLGPPELAPAPPDFELCRAPATHRFTGKHLNECNWLQVLENAIDSVHFSFLHDDARDAADSLYHAVPRIEQERAPYGLIGAALHDLGAQGVHARSYHWVLPGHSIRARTTDYANRMAAIPTTRGQTIVPIDDERCWTYSYIYSYDPAIPLNAEFVERENAAYGRGTDDVLPGYRLKRNRENDYLIDRALQKTSSYSGIKGVNTQDMALQECAGAIIDRSKEHLSVTDAVIILTRRILLDAIDTAERGGDPPGADVATYRDLRGSARTIPQGADWRIALAPEFAAKF